MRTQRRRLSGVAFSVIAVVALAAAVGWGMNIFKLIHMLDGGLTAMFVARIVGVFAVPLGSVLGFF